MVINVMFLTNPLWIKKTHFRRRIGIHMSKTIYMFIYYTSLQYILSHLILSHFVSTNTIAQNIHR